MRRQTDSIETLAVTTRAECEALDAADPLASFRQAFQLPRNIIYLDGNSLGACPKASLDRLSRTASHEWACPLGNAQARLRGDFSGLDRRRLIAAFRFRRLA